MRRSEASLCLVAQNFEIFPKIQIKNKKIKKTLAVEVLFEAFLNDTTLMKIKSGRTIPFKEKYYF
jgi:hypothetical protein